MRTFKLILCYDGTAYAGWQSQRGKPTVQDSLEAAIQKVTGQSVRVLASGRTDAGVHALGQVVGLQVETKSSAAVLQRALNANLPPDIAVLSAVEVPHGFHATHHAVRKRYRYVIHDGPVRNVIQRQYAWHYPHGPLDADAMNRAAAALRGTHDFSSFETSGAERRSSVRTIFDISVRRLRQPPQDFAAGFGEGRGEDAGDGEDTAAQQPWIVVEVEADGFLYNMVRTMVGTLVEVGRGARPESWPAEVLRMRDRRAAGRTVPAQGLFLVHVEYGAKQEGIRSP